MNAFRRLTVLDWLVMGYAFFLLFAVMVGSSDFYESARAYRFVVLGPILIYAAVRLLPFSLEVVTRGHALLAIVVFFQTLYVIQQYFELGERPTGLIHDFVGYSVIYAFTAAYVLTYLVFSWRSIGSVTLKLLSLIAIGTLGFGLYASASRGVVLPLLVMILVTTWIWRSAYKRMLLVRGAKVMVLLLLFLTIFAPPKFDYDASKVYETKNYSDRIISLDGYLADTTGRIQFWSYLFDIAMEQPILGHGMSAYALGTTVIVKKKGHIPHHSHNVLVAAVLAGGLIGLILTLGLIFEMLNLMRRFTGQPGPAQVFEKTMLVGAAVFLVVALTNMSALGAFFFFMIGLIQQLALHSGVAAGNLSDGAAKPLPGRQSAIRKTLLVTKGST